VITVCFVCSWVYLSGNLCAKIAELTVSWYSITHTAQRNVCSDDGGLPWPAATNWSHSSLLNSAVCYMVSWLPFTSILIYSHPNACCFIFLLLPVFWLIFKCGSWAIFFLAVLEALWWTKCWLRCCGVPASAALDGAPINQLGLDLLLPCSGISVFMICWFGIAEEDYNEKMRDVLRNIYLSSSPNGICNSQHARSTHDASCCVWLQVAGISHCPVMCNKLVWSFMVVTRINGRFWQPEFAECQ